MKWLLLLIYVINFNSGNSDSSSPVSSVDQVVLTASDNCVDRLVKAEKIYRAKEGYGIKGGTTSVKGDLILGLDTMYHITNMTVYAAAVADKDASGTRGLVVMGQERVWNTGTATTLQPYTFTMDSVTDEIHITSKVASNGRFYVQKVEFTADDPRPNRGKIELQYPVYKFPSMAYDSLSAAEDAEVFQVSAKNIDVNGLSLRMAQGRVFSVSPTSLPGEGGTFEISYSCNYQSNSIKDTIIVSGTGADGIVVSKRFPVNVTIYNYTPQPVDSTGMQIRVAPGDYYQDIQGLQDSALKTALGMLINCGVRYRYGSGPDHTWAAFYYTDRDTTDNRVIDMYSEEEHYFNSERPTAAVSGFDIEHMLPKSWWGGDVNAAYCDLYHLVPGNASANRSKSNHAPGIPTDSSFYNGSFVTGADAVRGLERAFCPADEYKGDFARAYFYIACCYGDVLTWKTSGEAGTAMTNESWEEFLPWLRDLLLSWHRADPVSEKETRRAIEVNKIQGNRNPFIDYPELVELIWGNRKGDAADFQALVCSFEDSTTGVCNFEAKERASKIIKDGRVVIVRGEEMYSILGVRL